MKQTVQNTLTKRQKELLDFILSFMDKNGYVPSYRKIADKLMKKGYLEKRGNSSKFIPTGKTLRLTKKFSVPVMGTIAAGSPIRIFEYQENLMIPKNLISRQRGELFALEVKGYSMIEEGIMDGDYVICEPSQNVKNGDVVVALVNGDEVTLKKYYKEKNWIRLMPANSKMRPILSRNVLIQGVVKAVFRKY